MPARRRTRRNRGRAPTASPRTCRRHPRGFGRSGRSHILQPGDERAHSRVDVVNDATYGRQVLPGRVVDRPVLVTLTGKHRTRLAASHCDHDVAAADEVVVELRRHVTIDVEPALREDLRNDGVHTGPW